MATEHEPTALDAPAQAGGVPRHASAKERRARGLVPFLSDLKAEVQNQLSRTETQARPADAHGQVTQVVYPAGQVPQIEAAPQAHPQQPADDGTALAAAALATADHAGAEAEAARAYADAARAEAAAARAEATAARTEAATAHATSARADGQLQAARAEIDAAHKEFEALRTAFDAARERTRQHILISWIGAGAATLLAVVALILGS
jgi:hypothetical protein